MIQLNSKTLSDILSLDYQGQPFEINGISTDTRTVEPGNLFITWKGENFDGHQFCQQAVEKGAAALLVTKHQSDLNIPQLVVDDTIKALGQIVSCWRDQFDIPVIGVTGSNGKTTVKNMLASIAKAAVGEHYLAPIKSFNNHVGVPLTLSKLNQDHRYAIIEMGMNHFGEMRYLTHIVKPTVVVINNAYYSHVAGVGSVEGVAKAKGEIIEGLQPAGTAVFNADDQFFDFWKSLLAEHDAGASVMSFGLENRADITATNIQMNEKGGLFKLQTPEGELDVQLPLLGKHNVMNALAATAAALAVNISLPHIKAGLESVEPENHRLQLKPLINGALLIDDSYNANPASTRMAIDVLSKQSGETFLVLGDMRELGDEEKRLHEEIGHYAKSANIKHFYAVGDLMRSAVDAFGHGAKHFDSKPLLLKTIKDTLPKEAVVLVKGSLSMGMLDIVSGLTQQG